MIITRNKIICKIKTNNLNIQSNATKKNGLTASFSGTNKSVSVTGASHNHGGYTGYTQPAFSGTAVDTDEKGEGSINRINYNNSSDPTYSGVLSYTAQPYDSQVGSTGSSSTGKMELKIANHKHSVTPKGTVENHRHTISNSGTLSMSGDYTPAGNVTVGAGDSETRPDNYSYVIWKRIA